MTEAWINDIVFDKWGHLLHQHLCTCSSNHNWYKLKPLQIKSSFARGTNLFLSSDKTLHFQRCVTCKLSRLKMETSLTFSKWVRLGCLLISGLEYGDWVLLNLLNATSLCKHSNNDVTYMELFVSRNIFKTLFKFPKCWRHAMKKDLIYMTKATISHL